MPLIVLKDGPVKYELVRDARRKRLSLQVTQDNSVVVRAPIDSQDREIERFIRSNADWLRAALDPERVADERKRRIRDDQGVIEYELTRNPRRKRLTVLVHPYEGVEVRAPAGATDRSIQQFVREQAGWIRARLAELEATAPPVREYVNGETILFRGEPHSLEVEASASGEPRVEARDGTLLVRIRHTTDEQTQRKMAERAVRRWFIDRALETTRERMPLFAEKLDVQPRKVAIKDMKSRWGSCSGKGNISISFRIVMAPPEVMDYLIVHELCHLVHHNHSAEFWSLLASIIPRYDDHKRWLSENEFALEL